MRGVGRNARRERNHQLLPGGLETRTVIQLGMLLLGILYTLYLARFVLIPLAAALLLYQVLYQPVRGLSRRGIPMWASAVVILVGMLVTIGWAAHYLVDPAEEWLHQAPTSLRELRHELRATAGTGPFEELRELGEEVEELMEMNEQEARVQTVRIEGPSLLGGFFAGLESFAAGLMICFFTCFFLLSNGNRLARQLVGLGRSRSARRRISSILRSVRDEVSAYLGTVTLINIALGAAVAVALYLIGVPNAPLWGTMVAVLNFAPYIGAAVNIFVLLVVGVTTFDTLGQALVVPAVFLVLTSLEGSVITPLILGQRVSLGSLGVFLSVVFWGWVWGPVGALMAVPITASLNVLWRHLRDVQVGDPGLAARAGDRVASA